MLVGLEIHVQLATKSKMFTAARNGFGGSPNSQVDPVILGLPGVLPVMNRTAVEYTIMVGLALGCRIAKHTKWDRKSYYYPDLPKNYQISQYDLPLCGEGTYELNLAGPLALESGEQTKTIRIRRAHLEEDAGKLMHEAPGGFPIDHSIVDLNRAGTPLLEIVTEPDFTTGAEVAAFGQELQQLVQSLGVSEAQMQMGHMRFEPNINVHITDDHGQIHKTAITEIKNLNSFSVLQRATDYEVRRQVHEWIETGHLGKKCTMGWDEPTESTFLQREKEEAHDYRYFPDPDLVPVEVDEAWLDEIRLKIGELPAARHTQFSEQYKLSPADTDILAGDRQLADYYEQSVKAGADPKRAANLIINVIATIAKKTNSALHATSIIPDQIAQAAKLIDENKLGASSALPLFEHLAALPASAGGESVEEHAQKLNLIQSTDTGEVDKAIDALIAQNPKPLQDWKAGKQAALGALTGMILRTAKGMNPKIVQERLKAKILQ